VRAEPWHSSLHLRGAAEEKALSNDWNETEREPGVHCSHQAEEIFEVLACDGGSVVQVRAAMSSEARAGRPGKTESVCEIHSGPHAVVDKAADMAVARGDYDEKAAAVNIGDVAVATWAAGKQSEVVSVLDCRCSLGVRCSRVVEFVHCRGDP